MSVDQLEIGMQWITSRLTAFAGEAGLEVRPTEWAASIEDFKNDRHSLAVLVRGDRKVLNFLILIWKTFPPTTRCKARSRMSCGRSSSASMAGNQQTSVM